MGLERRAGIVTGDAWRSNVAQRLLRVEQRRPDVDDEGSFADPPRTVTWSLPAPSERVWPGWEAIIEEWVGTVVLRADTAGTTATEVDVLVDGVSKATATLDASETRSVTEVSVTVPAGSQVAPEITALGTGLDGLMVQMRVTP